MPSVILRNKYKMKHFSVTRVSAAGFDELYCECGASVMYPPVACGTAPPPCDQPCSRLHPCGHPVLHNCHSYPDCPPCTQLMKKFCYGGHEVSGRQGWGRGGGL